MRCHVIDSLEAIGGQCAALYPEKPIFDIPGHPKIDAQALIDNLARQAEPFAPIYHLDQQVVSLAPQAGGFALKTGKGVEIRAKAVLVAAGAGAFGPNRPPLADLAAYEGKSVYYLVRRREDMRGKRVVIAGGGDSAVDWTLSLADVASRVMVVHRRDKFRATPESTAQLAKLAKDGRIDLVVPYQLDALDGRDGQLSAVIVKDLDGKTRRLEADVLLPFFGLAMDLGPIAGWGLSLAKNHVTVDPASMATSVPGIYAIGDIASYPGKLKLILSGFAEAATAAHAAYARLFPDTPLHFEYSTTKGVPGR
jgi:thioredoxin reductase (NADPH)